MAELVSNGETGLLFDPGDPQSLAAKMHWADEHPAAMLAMGCAARLEYEQKFTSATNFALLMDIYAAAMQEAAR